MRKALSAVVLVVLVSCGQAVLKPASTGPTPKPFDPPTSWALFLTGDQSLQQSYSRTPLDAATLKDAGAPVAGHGYATVSADGSTLAEIDYKPNTTSSISISDTRTGALRTSFQSAIATGPALRPDGSHRAVRCADGSRLMTIDPIGLKITATRPVVVPSAPTSWLGVGPIEADAKAEVGTIWNINSSPDGRRLIAAAHELTIDPTSQVSTSRGLGVRIIDVPSSTVAADRRGLALGQ